MQPQEEESDDLERDPDDLTDEEVDDEMLLEALVNRQLQAHIAIKMCQRLEKDANLRKQLSNIVCSQALLASVLDPKLRPTTPECDFARERFAAYADQTLAHGEISVFSAHLQACSLCAVGYEAYELEREDMAAEAAAAQRTPGEPARTGELRTVGAGDTPPAGDSAALRPAAGSAPAATSGSTRSSWCGDRRRNRWLAVASVALAVTAFASGRWTSGAASAAPPASAGGSFAAGHASTAAATEIVAPATTPPDLAAAVAELLAMHPWTAEQRAQLQPLADPNLGSDARAAALGNIAKLGYRVPEGLGWALAAWEASSAVRVCCYAVRYAGGGGGDTVNVGQALRALDRELAAGAYAPAGRVLAILTRAGPTATLRSVLLDVLARAATAPSALAVETGVAVHAADLFAGDTSVHAGLEALTANADPRVRVVGLGALVAEAARMHDDSAREAALARVAPYLAHADAAVAARARLPFRDHATQADMSAAVAALGSPPPHWDALCEFVTKRVAVVVD